jgi:glutathione S-transferase
MSDQAAHPLVLAGQYWSPYTRKMRAVLRYRQIPFRWVLRDSKWDDLPPPPVPIIPVIAYPNESGDGYDDVTVDSSPQIMRLEAEHSGRSVVPTDPALAFIDMLLEDFGDEWVTKMMYHYRWAYEPDIDKAGKLLPLGGNLQLDSDQAQQGYDFITNRQIGRRAMVGSTEWNTPLIEASYRRVLAIMQARFSRGDFLLGERPGRGDFGIFGQLTQLVQFDPTSMQIAVDEAPKVIRWVERADDLSWLPVDDDGGWSVLEKLDPAINDLLVECGRTYAPFLVANAQALASGADEVACQIASGDGQRREYRQAPFGYQGKCLAWLREAHAALTESDRSRVDAVLDGTGCEQLFTERAA